VHHLTLLLQSSSTMGRGSTALLSLSLLRIVVVTHHEVVSDMTAFAIATVAHAPSSHRHCSYSLLVFRHHFSVFILMISVLHFFEFQFFLYTTLIAGPHHRFSWFSLFEAQTYSPFALSSFHRCLRIVAVPAVSLIHQPSPSDSRRCFC
jgi:hypothetical protein